MPDEEVVEEEVVEEEKNPQEKELSDVEKIATQLGWNPEHEGERNFKTAEEFILASKEIRNTANKKIKKQDRDIEQLKNGFQAFQDHTKALYQAQLTALQNEVSQLKRSRRDAVEDGDDNTVRDIDNRLRAIDNLPKQLPDGPANYDPAFVDWLDDNEWYENDSDLRVYADALGEQPEYKALFKSKGYPETLKMIEQKVKEVFSHKFNPQPKPQLPKTPAVESPSARRAPSSKKPKYTEADLSREQLELAEMFERKGIKTKAEYIKELEEIEAARSL
jgi:hypothetical protein